MYDLKHFKENNKTKLLDFIAKYPLAFLTGSQSDGTQVATQIPMLVRERQGELFLQGHLMKNTDHHKAFSENPQVLAVFSGPQAYVSASWYSNPQSGSTWNYMSVHIIGEIRWLTDKELVKFMKELTLKFEDENAQSPTIYDNLPRQYLKKNMPAISGFEIKADKIENTFKLSQDKDEKSYRNIIEQLEQKGGNSALVAQEMRENLKDLFPENHK